MVRGDLKELLFNGERISLHRMANFQDQSLSRNSLDVFFKLPDRFGKDGLFVRTLNQSIIPVSHEFDMIERHNYDLVILNRYHVYPWDSSLCSWT